MSETLTPELRQVVVLDLAKLAQEKYVYPDVGEKLSTSIRAKLQQGGYNEIAEARQLAVTLTEDLRALSNDRHWSVVYEPQRLPENIDPETEQDQAQLAQWLAQARRRNFGFEKVERLQGNIGYIDLREFAPSEYAGETAVAAMGFVANCDALIFDLRQNHGGYPSMVQLITSYLYDAEPRHINTFYYRPSDDYQQFWTFPHVPGKRLPELPVYVLTSGATGSGAEEFAYNLKHMGRATLVGETTGGAAHPVTREVIQELFIVALPYGRPINPITQENWESSGVEPHIIVPQENALKRAHLHAVAQLVEHCQDEQRKRDLAWEAETLESLYAPRTVGDASLARYAGSYGQRSFVVKDGALTYVHQAYAAAWRLIPITETRFRLGDELKFEFLLDDQGTASTVTISYRDGRPDLTVARTG